MRWYALQYQAGLSTPVEFDDKQLSWIGQTLADHPSVRWTFLFMHEPCWEKPSDRFETLQTILKGRMHTFLAGHLHHYDYDNIDGYEYITMGPVGRRSTTKVPATSITSCG